VYTRHGISSINQKTFENAIVHNVPPLIQANQGGYYVEIDGEALKKRRQELGLSAGEVAEMVRTSRRTIYGYERGMAKASVSAAYNLIWSLGIPVGRSVNILAKPAPQRKSCVFATARVMLSKNRILGKLFKRCAQYRFATVKRAPFDFVINDPKEKLRIIGGIANRKEPALNKRVDEILSLSKVTRAHPILITEGQQQINRDIQCFTGEDFSRIRTPEDLIASVT
jgi:putative transcriptional regulator